MKNTKLLRILKNGQKGFSLLEMLFVVAIAGVIVLVVANIPNAIGLIGKSNHESIAKEVAIENIESVRSRTYANLANGSTAITDSRISSLPGGTGTVLIEDCPQTICSVQTDIKKISVTISWTEQNEPKSVVLTTLVAEGGLQ